MRETVHNFSGYEVPTESSVAIMKASELRAFLGTNINAEDSLLEKLIKTARVAVEKYISYKLIDTTVEYYVDSVTFLGRQGLYGSELAYSQIDALTQGSQYVATIPLPLKPVSSITSITTYDSDNAGTVYSSSNYFLDTVNNRVMFNNDATTPSNLRQASAYKVTHVVGFGATADDVPEDIKTAIKIYAKNLYLPISQGRSIDEVGTAPYDMPTGAKLILDMYKEMYGF